MKNLIKLYLLMAVALCSCDDPYENSTYQIYDTNPVSTYLESRSDEFSEWISILKYADLFNAINQASELFTVFVPDNDAVLEFYKKRNVTSIADLGAEYARNLVKFHIISDSVTLETFIKGGKLESKTLSDDYLTVSFDEESGGGFNSVYMNKEARVTELAIKVSNGYVYVMDAVMSPLVESVYERVSEAGVYSIFEEALSLTGWKDSLNTIYDQIRQPNGTLIQQKRNYTLLAVPNSSFQQDGIGSVADLAAKLGAGTDYTNAENELFLYVAYHILKGNYSILELQKFDGNEKKKLMDTSSGNILEITEESLGDFWLNRAGGEDVRAQFIESSSDIQAKNGMLHQIDSYLPIWESVVPTEVKFDFCNYPEVSAYIAARPGTAGQSFQAQMSGSTEGYTNIAYVTSYTVDSKGFKYNPKREYGTPIGALEYMTPKNSGGWSGGTMLNNDHLVINVGNTGSVSMKTPAIIKGKYKVTLYFCYATSQNFMRQQTENSNGGKMEFSFDGEHALEIAPYPTVPGNTLGVYSCVAYEELEFTKTGTHTFKILVKDPVASSHSNFRITLDHLHFEPIIVEEP